MNVKSSFHKGPGGEERSFVHVAIKTDSFCTLRGGRCQKLNIVIKLFCLREIFVLLFLNCELLRVGNRM